MPHQSKNGNGKCISVGDEGMCELIRETMAKVPLIQRHDDDAGLGFTRESLPGYEIVESVGSGGQGKVYKAYKKGQKRSVAIKVLLDGPFANRRQERRLWREIKLLRRLNHPGIITVHDSGSIQGRPYLVMPFVYGCPIGVHALAEDLDLSQRIELFLDACDAVSAAHAKGIVHRDLKPANIMVDSEGRVRLLDFGLAKDMSGNDDTPSSELSMSGCRVGTARYSSPEQIMGGTVDVQSDIYSLGVVLFELLSHEMPYVRTDTIYSDVDLIMNGERLRLREAVRNSTKENPLLCCYTPKDVGRDLETVLDTAMAIDPDLRYATVDEFARDLRRYIDGHSVKAQIGVGQRIRSRFRAYRVKLAVAAMIAALATSSTIAMFSWNSARESERKTQEAARVAHAVIGVAAFVRMAERNVQASEFDHAKATLLEAISLSEVIPPSDPEAYRPVYTAYHDLADLAFRSNDLDNARTYSQHAIDIVEKIRREYPSDQLWFRLEGFSHKLRGRIAYAEKDWAIALGHFERMLEVRDELLTSSPLLVGHQIEVVNACAWVGNAARHDGQQAYAIDILQRAIAISTNLVDQHPNEVEHVVRLGHAESDLGAALMSHGIHEDRALAAKWFTAARSRLLSAQDAGSLGKWKTTASGRLALIERNLSIINKKKD